MYHVYVLKQMKLTLTLTLCGFQIGNLGLVRFMSINVFCFHSQDGIFMSVSELEQRSLLPEAFESMINPQVYSLLKPHHVSDLVTTRQ
jgi:hypothetical protein